jgi:hypothetical protein
MVSNPATIPNFERELDGEVVVVVVVAVKI